MCGRGEGCATEYTLEARVAVFVGAEIVKMFTRPSVKELGDVATGPSRQPYVLIRHVANTEDGPVVNTESGILLQHPFAPRLDSVDVAQQPIYGGHQLRGDDHRQAGPLRREDDVRRFGQSDLVRRQHLRL